MALILYASALIRHTLAIILASLMSVSGRFNASQILPPYHLVGHHALVYNSQNRKLRIPIGTKKLLTVILFMLALSQSPQANADWKFESSNKPSGLTTYATSYWINVVGPINILTLL